MNHSPFWPLVWKEYRTGRSFWLALAAMGLAAQGGVRWLAHQPTERDWWLYGIALMISAAFAVGIGGTSFAAEHEDRTIALLRRLPLRARELGAAKMLAALAGLVTLVAVLWFAARAMAGGQSLSDTEASRLWTMWGLACLEGLAWGVFYSLLIRHPLRATMAAALTTAFVDACAVMLTERHDFSATSYAESIPLRAAVLVLVVLVDAAMLPWWLAGHFPRRKSWRQWPSVMRLTESTWRRPLVHLAWQTMREGRASFVLLILAVPVVFVFLRIGFATGTVVGNRILGPGLSTFVLVLTLLSLLATVNGALVFQADQRHGPRFLAEQGVSPRTVWCSRQLVWGSWLWALLVIVALSFIAVFSLAVLLHIVRNLSQATGPIFGHRFFSGVEPLLIAGLTTLEMLLPAYAAGQLASLLVRRGLLAVTLGLVLGLIMAYWVFAMWAIGAGWWWSVLPLPVGFLLATWLRLPAWLVERSHPRAWIAPAAAALLPVAGLLVAVPAYRVLQISAANPEFCQIATSPAAIADARGTLELYTKAWDLYLANRDQATEPPAGDADSTTTTPPDNAWRKEVVKLATETSRRKFSLLALPIPERRAAAKRIQELSDFLISFAQDEQKAGRLDTALNAYLATFALQTQHHECCGNCQPDYARTLRGLRAWAAAPDQTVGLIHKAMRRLGECHAALPAPDARLLPEYEESLLAINDLEAAAAAGIVPAKDLGAGDWITSRIPSERARARRMLDWLANYQLNVARSVVEVLGQQRRIVNYAAFSTEGGRYLARKYRLPNAEDRRVSNPDGLTTFLQIYLLTTPLIDHCELIHQPMAKILVREETDYRATVIVLALNAWKAEHGQLPERLDELVGSELDKLPPDPLFALPFQYFPRGTPAQQAVWTNAGSVSAVGVQTPGVSSGFWTSPRQLVTGEPFLWSALRGSEHSVVLLPTESGAAQAEFPYGLLAGSEVRQSPLGVVLEAGTVYPVSPSMEGKQP